MLNRTLQHELWVSDEVVNQAHVSDRHRQPRYHRRTLLNAPTQVGLPRFDARCTFPAIAWLSVSDYGVGRRALVHSSDAETRTTVNTGD
jgi:hypothetical protein